MTDFRIVLLTLMLVLAGCNAFSGEASTQTPTEISEDRGRNSLAIHSLNHNNSSFYMNASISYMEPPSVDDESFNDVMACLYDADGNVINATEVGNFSGAIDSGEFELSADQRPAYIVVDHPRYHDYALMPPLVLEWTEHGYYLEHHGSLGSIQDVFEYPRHNETGRCL